MPRRRRRDEDSPASVAEGLVLLAFGIMAYLIWRFKNNLGVLAFWIVGLMVLGTIAGLIVREPIESTKRKRVERLVQRARTAGKEQEILNFIVRFDGERGKKEEKRDFGTKSFLRERLNLFIEDLNNKGFKIDADEFCILLRYYIHKQDLELTSASVSTIPKKFDSLSGTDFEHLLERLYNARGYQVQWMGGVGDQGGDLIANKPGERILIQAKRYKGSVGNEAVQEAAAAKTHYDCSTAVVVTSGYFTREAVALAKTTGVLFVGKAELQQFLLDFLKESWA